MTAPSVFTIPAGVSFVDTLAQGVMRDITAAIHLHYRIALFCFLTAGPAVL